MKNKSILRTPAVCLLGLAMSVGLTPSAGAEVTTDYSLDLLSAYVWRGIAFTDGLVFQPSWTSAHDSGFSINLWGNLDIDNVNGLGGDFQEIDITLSYAFPSDSNFSAEVGLIEYLFPNEVGPGTRELYVSLGWDVTAQPGISIYYDIDEVEDWYANFSLGHSHALDDASSLDFALGIGAAGDEFAVINGGGIVGQAGDGLFDLLATVGYSRASETGWGFTVLVAYVDSLDTDQLVDQSVDIYGAIGISRSF